MFKLIGLRYWRFWIIVWDRLYCLMHMGLYIIKWEVERNGEVRKKKCVCVSVCLHLLNSFNMGEVISSAGPVCAFQIAIQLFKLMNVFITNNVIRCSMFQQLFDILISSFHFFSVSPRSYCNCKVIFTKIYSSRNRVEQHYHAASFPFFCSLELMPILWLLLELFPLDMPFKCGLHVSWPYCRVSPIMVVRIFCNISSTSMNASSCLHSLLAFRGHFSTGRTGSSILYLVFMLCEYQVKGYPGMFCLIKKIITHLWFLVILQHTNLAVNWDRNFPGHLCY